MRVLPNYVYSFEFTSSFNGLNGIYRVLSVQSYPELVKLGIPLLELYTDNGLTQVEFDLDLETIRSSHIFQLVSVNDPNDIIYIPEHLLNKIPDANVQQYLRLGIASVIGTFESMDDVTTIKSEVEQVLESMTGITNNATIYSVKEEWMTSAEYEVIATERANNASRISNFYTDTLELQQQVNQLTTLIGYYEDTFKNL